MVVSAVFILDLKGKVIISRGYRGDVGTSVAEKFAKHISEDEEQALKPVIYDGELTFVYIKHNNLYIMAVTRKNANVVAILSFLYKIVSVFEDYFRELEQESIRDNFVITYELLDEMMDFGYPQHTDANILKEFIMVQEAHKLRKDKADKISDTLTNAIGWRPQGIVHKRNEVYLDVVEKLNLLVSNSGMVLHSEILGALKMRVFLSGMPELKLGLNDKILLESRGRAPRGKTVELEDIRFHQCVRLSKFENDRAIEFIPPDGEFELMSYRLPTSVRPLIWIEAHVEPYGRSRIEYFVKIKSNFKRRSSAINVEITIPVPCDADSPTFKTSIGSARYVADKDAILWSIKQFQGQREFFLRAHFGLPSVSAEEEFENKAPISVKFEIPYFTVSGIQVRYLKIVEKSGYHALPWVRYITQNGDYQLRVV